jgi:TRAP-type C4-dicarboxylate transport system permease small subunit
MEYGDVSTLLSVPMWIPMMLLLPSLLLLALAALARILDLLKIGREETAAAAQGVQA